MPKFVTEFTVNSHDTDKNGNLYPSTALRYLHEAANLQFEASHPTLDELRYEEKKAFLLSRATMELVRPLRAFEKVTAITWSGGGKAASFYRCGELKVHDEVVGKLVSIWALLDLETRRLCRVRDTDLGIEAIEEFPQDIPGHIRYPEDIPAWEAVGKRRVFNSDIDINGHMNNTNYPDMLCDFIPGIENKIVRSFTIGYIHEAKLGEELTVYHAAVGNVHYLKTERADGSANAEAIIETEDVI